MWSPCRLTLAVCWVLGWPWRLGGRLGGGARSVARGVASPMLLARRPGVALAAEAATVTSAIAAASVSSATAIVAAVPALHDYRGFGLQLVDTHGQIAQNVFVETHGPLHFLHRDRRRVDVEQHIVAFAIFLDAVGQTTQTPHLLLANFAAIFRNHTGKLVCEGFGLGSRNILARDEHALVKCHALTLPKVIDEPALIYPFSRPVLADSVHGVGKEL